MRIIKLILIIFILQPLSLIAQKTDIYVNNDTIYAEDKFVGYIKYKKRKKYGVVGNFEARKLLRSKLDVDDCIVEKDLVLNFDTETNKILNYKGHQVGEFSTVKRVILPSELNVKMFTGDYSPVAVKNYFFSSSSYFLTTRINVTYTEKDYKTQREEDIARKKLVQKQKIERFYSQVFERLKGNIDEIEGVYKSIDLGEGTEYEIAILKSSENSREYISLVLSTTDKNLPIGAGLFTFVKTAQPNLFFVEYQLKSGLSVENKTAVLNGALLEMGIKSFVKMYPGEGDTKKYQEINPSFDWESSGSGVLLNKDGYIATNNHVIDNGKEIRIAFQNDTTDYNAVIISQNTETDVAILKIEDPRFSSTVAPMKWQTNFSLGQKVFTLGYPISNKMGNNVKVVDGIVSGMTGRDEDSHFFQTTLPVWYGNSGGPVFNDHGEIIGLATQILWDNGIKMDNVAYATKTENILSLFRSLDESDSTQSSPLSLESLVTELVPYSVFIKVNY